MRCWVVPITKPYPYLYRDKDRASQARWRLRMPGRRAFTIKGPYGSPEFAANYRAVAEGTRAERHGVPTKHGKYGGPCSILSTVRGLRPISASKGHAVIWSRPTSSANGAI